MKPGRKRRHLKLVDATAETQTSPTEDSNESCDGLTKSGTACKKPAGQGTEHVGAGRCRVHDGQVAKGSPCPLPLNDLELRLWGELSGDLAALRLDRAAFWGHKYGYVVALAGLHAARESAKGAAATIRGDNGAMKKHPSSTVVNQMLAHIRQYSNDLGLNPSALAAMDIGPDPNQKPSSMEQLIRGRRTR